MKTPPKTHQTSRQINLTEDAFEAYFSGLYGARWEALRRALAEDEKNYAAIAAAATSDGPEQKEAAAYFLDAASQEAARGIYRLVRAAAENLGGADAQNSVIKILDMCAAPGGKILSVLECIATEKYEAECETNKPAAWDIRINDSSPARASRLRENMRRYAAHHARASIRIECKNGALYGKTHPDYFDAVIVDAPCSSERYLIRRQEAAQKSSDKSLGASHKKYSGPFKKQYAADGTAAWSAKRSARNAAEQTSLLCAAADCCKPGGLICYLTCSINPEENERVLARVLTKRSVRIVSAEALFTAAATTAALMPENTPEGYAYIFPDTSNGSGPLFAAVLQKQPRG